MKITKAKKNDERNILTGMIVSTTVLGRIYSKWQPRMFKSTWANTIANWTIRYYKKYKKAPKSDIEGLYSKWSEKAKDKHTIEIVGNYLSSLSNSYKRLEKGLNNDYVIDVAGRYFNKVKMERLLESTQDELDDGEVTKAHQKLSAYNRIEMGVGEGIDVLQDKEAIQEAFEDKKKPLIKYPGDFGKLINWALERDGFISFMGKKGIGKTFWLMDIAYQSMLQRKRVAFFEVGDMSQNQVMRRWMSRASKQPLYKLKIKLPTKLIIRKREGKKYARVKTKVIRYDKKLTWSKAVKMSKKVMRKEVKSKKPYLKLSTHPNSSLGVDGIESILRDWERLDWTPDVIVVDYADILNMDYFGIEGRDRINETWKRLRRLSQDWHCLLVTATQSDADSYEKGLLGMGNFTDDRRKIDSVTAMIGINQTPEEKGKGVFRLNFVSLRDDDFYTSRCVYVAGCLGICRPVIISKY